jgi:putative Mg2+ transporter-C (MgtC) family protein
VVAAIGMAVGAGAYLHAVVGTLLVMVALLLLGRLDDHLLPHFAPERTLRVVLEPRAELVAAIEHLLNAAGYQVRSVDVERSEDALIASFATRGAGRDYDRALQVTLGGEGVRQVTVL